MEAVFSKTSMQSNTCVYTLAPVADKIVTVQAQHQWLWSTFVAVHVWTGASHMSSQPMLRKPQHVSWDLVAHGRIRCNPQTARIVGKMLGRATGKVNAMFEMV